MVDREALGRHKRARNACSVFRIIYYLLLVSHDVTKIQATKQTILRRCYFQDVLKQLKTYFHANFRFERVLGFVIEYP